MAAEHTIKVSQETYDRLNTEAHVRGVSIEQFLEIILQELEKAKERAFIESLRAEGWIASFPPSEISIPSDFKPVLVKGEPVSQTIIEDREPR